MIARDLSKPGLGTQLGPVLVTTRIGITKAAAMPLRFCLKGSPHLSRPAAGKQARQIPQLHPGARRVD
jgi:3-methyladenine DNA glycosylase Mpg